MCKFDSQNGLSKNTIWLIACVVVLVVALSLSGCTVNSPSGNTNQNNTNSGNVTENYDDPFRGLQRGDSTAMIKERMGVPNKVDAATGLSGYTYKNINFLEMNGSTQIAVADNMDVVLTLYYTAYGNQDDYNNAVEYYTKKMGNPSLMEEGRTRWTNWDDLSYLEITIKNERSVKIVISADE